MSLSLMLATQSAAGGVGVRREGDHLVVTRRVMFVRGHVEHVPASKAVVDAMASYLRGQAGIEIIVEGHSDIGGDEAENVRLSLARAEFVAQGLRRRGVTATIRAVGRGSAEPLVEANHPELWRNRRIEVRMLAVSTAAPVVATLDDDVAALVDNNTPPPAIALLDDTVSAAAPALPMLDDDTRVPVTLIDDAVVAAPALPMLDDLAAPARLTLIDDDDLLPVSFTAQPHIALLDDEPHIGLVD
jgi:hypothetical protein